MLSVAVPKGVWPSQCAGPAAVLPPTPYPFTLQTNKNHGDGQK